MNRKRRIDDELPVPKPVDVKQKAEILRKSREISVEKQKHYINIVEKIIDNFRLEKKKSLVTLDPESQELIENYKGLDEEIKWNLQKELFVQRCESYTRPVNKSDEKERHKQYDFVTTVLVLERYSEPFAFQCRVKY